MKTVDNILRGMRRLADEAERGDCYDLRGLGTDSLRAYADRIEAAAKRERELGAEAAQIVGEIGEIIGREATREKSSRVGNAAAMREALSDSCYAMFNFLKTQNGGYVEMANALDKAKAALAKPPRNCDVGTAEEQEERHNRWCKSMKQRTKDCWVVGCRKCFIKWSQMPYDEGGAKK